MSAHHRANWTRPKKFDLIRVVGNVERRRRKRRKRKRRRKEEEKKRKRRRKRRNKKQEEREETKNALVCCMAVCLRVAALDAPSCRKDSIFAQKNTHPNSNNIKPLSYHTTFPKRPIALVSDPNIANKFRY